MSKSELTYILTETMLVSGAQNDQFIDMVYQEVVAAHANWYAKHALLPYCNTYGTLNQHVKTSMWPTVFISL